MPAIRKREVHVEIAVFRSVEEQVFLRGEVVEHRLHRYACRLRDLGDRRLIEPAFPIQIERRLLKAIINPAMIAVWLTGPLLAYGLDDFSAGWLHAKLALVLVLSAFHGYLAKLVKVFAADANRRSAAYYRVLNEAPTVLMALIVVLVVVKPF